jgi:hypothetical protein
VENLWEMVLRWRVLILILQLALIAGCVLFGLRLASRAAQPAVTVHRAPAAPAHESQAPAIATVLQTGAPQSHAAKPLVPSTDFFSRLGHDDFNFYSAQWRALTVLMDGMRDYIEHRVIPALLKPLSG